MQDANPQLEEDLAAVREAMEGGSKRVPADAIMRLAGSVDDRALDLLLDAFAWARLRSGEPAASALARSAHPDVAVRLAARLDGWWEERELKHSRLCVAHGGKLLARLGDPRALEVVRALSERAKVHAVSLRGLLMARVGMGDEDAQRQVREQYTSGNANQGTDGYPKGMLGIVEAGAYYDTFAPIVEAYQAGDDGLASAAARVVMLLADALRDAPSGGAEEAQSRLDSRWFELGLALWRERPRPRLAPFADRLLDVPHPQRAAHLPAAPPSPLAGLPRVWRERHARGEWALLRRDGVHWLHAASLRLRECEELMPLLEAGLGEAVKGLSIRGRSTPAAAFKLIAKWPGLAAMTHLDVSFTWPSAKSFTALVSSPHLASLQFLDARGIDAKAPPYDLLARDDVLPSLRCLALLGGGDRAPKVRLASLLDLARGTRRLERLTLSRFTFPEPIAPFLESDLARSLEVLRIEERSHLGERGADVLAALSSHSTRLRRLGLTHSFRHRSSGDWNRAGTGALAHLEALDLRGSGAAHFPELAKAWFLPQLRELDLAEAPLFDDAHAPLLERSCPALERLSLRDATGLDHPRLRALADSPLAASLAWLDVGGATDLRARVALEVAPHVAAAMRAAGWRIPSRGD